jgi:hypothetical protein
MIGHFPSKAIIFSAVAPVILYSLTATVFPRIQRPISRSGRNTLKRNMRRCLQLAGLSGELASACVSTARRDYDSEHYIRVLRDSYAERMRVVFEAEDFSQLFDALIYLQNRGE